MVLNNVKKGEVAMKIKRGKEVPENPDRGVKLCQVGPDIRVISICVRISFQNGRIYISNQQSLFILCCLHFKSKYFLVLMVAVVCKVKESYHNLETLFSLLRLQEQRGVKMVFDLKAANLASGVQCARAR